jgi:hypothetical protein
MPLRSWPSRRPGPGSRTTAAAVARHNRRRCCLNPKLAPDSLALSHGHGGGRPPSRSPYDRLGAPPSADSESFRVREDSRAGN